MADTPFRWWEAGKTDTPPLTHDQMQALYASDDFRNRPFEQSTFDNGHMGWWCGECCRELPDSDSVVAFHFTQHPVKWTRIYRTTMLWRGTYKPRMQGILTPIKEDSND